MDSNIWKIRSQHHCNKHSFGFVLLSENTRKRFDTSSYATTGSLNSDYQYHAACLSRSELLFIGGKNV